MISEIHHTAMQGLNSNMHSMRQSASEIASSNPDKRLEHSMIEMKQTAHLATANTKVVKAVDEVLGNLIDVKA